MRPQVQKWIEIATTLREKTGTYFSITRLTSLKTLCQDPAVANEFTFYLATCTAANTQPPKYTKPQDWQHYRKLIVEAVALMQKYLHKPSKKLLAELREMRQKVETVQTYTGKEIWGHSIRTIYSREVLVIEDALQCMITPHAASFWAYKTARDYTEQYNSHYGSGLIPESIPMLEDIIRFWNERNSFQISRAPNPGIKPTGAPRRPTVPFS